MPSYLDKEVFGHKFKVVDPASIGLPQFNTGTFDEYEPPMLTHWSTLQPGELVVDAGACFGAYTMAALVLGASVIAYEPSADACRILQGNVDVNGWTERCTIRRSALWNVGDEPYPPELFADVFTNHYPAKDFPVVSLDDDLKKLGVSGVSWLKSDVEGAELGLLRSGVKMLERDHPRLIVEDHEDAAPNRNCIVSDYPASIHSSRKIGELLRSIGYDVEFWRPQDRKYIMASRSIVLPPL